MRQIRIGHIDPLFQAIGHTAEGPPSRPRRNRHLDVRIMAQAKARRAQLRHESDILARRQSLHAADTIVGDGAKGETGARVMTMMGPRIMNDRIDQGRQAIAEAGIAFMVASPCDEAWSEQRFFRIVPENRPADDVRTGLDRRQIGPNPVLVRPGIGVGDHHDALSGSRQQGARDLKAETTRRTDMRAMSRKLDHHRMKRQSGLVRRRSRSDLGGTIGAIVEDEYDGERTIGPREIPLAAERAEQFSDALRFVSHRNRNDGQELAAAKGC
ncbi:hypothetical protein MF134_15200 [Jiella sp. LLJ827]|nr:hypothetical protein [Jiella sp. LLJ827]MCQ0988995.1 hypothetical protein [Jiella sp. LLJ827]